MVIEVYGLRYNIYRSVYKDDDVHYLRVSRKTLKSARNAPQTICEYLKKEGCFGNATVVDTGWVGVAQTEIEGYAKIIDPSTDLGGCILASSSPSASRSIQKEAMAVCIQAFMNRYSVR